MTVWRTVAVVGLLGVKEHCLAYGDREALVEPRHGSSDLVITCSAGESGVRS